MLIMVYTISRVAPENIHMDSINGAELSTMAVMTSMDMGGLLGNQSDDSNPWSMTCTP